MPDIRIKDLTTTASSTASDDFFAADGTTNGTRKLSAFSPTFGGNATVGGTLTVTGVVTASNAVNASGIIGTTAVSQRITNTSGAFQIYKDATPSLAARFSLNTAASDIAAIGVYNGSSWTDPLQINTTQVLVTTTTASNSTSSGALVVSGGVGVAKSINAGTTGADHSHVFTGGDGGSGSTIFAIKDYFGTTKFLVDGIGGIQAGASLSLTGASNVFRIVNSQTPASASATGTSGTICWDTSYIYVCTATNTWKRAAISTW